MASDPQRPILLIPCSGIGKVQGLISREAVFHVADTLAPGQTEPMCLALLVTDDAEAKERVHSHECVTVDGCPKLCARKNVERSGGEVAVGVRVYETLKRRRGAQFGSPTALSDDGWAAVEEIAREIVETAKAMRQ